LARSDREGRDSDIGYHGSLEWFSNGLSVGNRLGRSVKRYGTPIALGARVVDRRGMVANECPKIWWRPGRGIEAARQPL